MAMHVYRFGDQVALNPPEGDTFYLTIPEAFKLSAAIDGVILDYMAREFVDSIAGTVAIESDGKRK